LWDTIATEAERQSPLWGDALLPAAERDAERVFSTLAADRYALGLETIYEGYLVHYGRSRLFRARDDAEALLLGDYLYAHGLVRIAELGEVEAIEALSALIAECAHLRAEGAPGDGKLWASTALGLGGGTDERERAVAAHSRRVG
jgi:hypothetical protein